MKLRITISLFISLAVFREGYACRFPIDVNNDSKWWVPKPKSPQSSICFVCRFSDDGRFVWRRNGLSLNATSGKYLIRSDAGNRSVLYLYRVTVEDRGVFICQRLTPNGTLLDEVSAVVTIFDPNVSTAPGVRKAFLPGREVNIDCATAYLVREYGPVLVCNFDRLHPYQAYEESINSSIFPVNTTTVQDSSLYRCRCFHEGRIYITHNVTLYIENTLTSEASATATSSPRFRTATVTQFDADIVLSTRQTPEAETQTPGLSYNSTFTEVPHVDENDTTTTIVASISAIVGVVIIIIGALMIVKKCLARCGTNSFETVEGERQQTEMADARPQEGVDRSPTDAETRSICKKISSRWEGFAIEVDPPLEIQDIENIQRANQHDPCYQATVMLERWMQKYTSKATARHLIEALVRFGRRDVAEEVFTPLTVEQVVVEPQDPK